MKASLTLGAALFLATPALAQYGGGAQNSGGPLGSYARSAGVGYGGPYGGYAYSPGAYSWGGPSITATLPIMAARLRPVRIIRGVIIGPTRGSIGAGRGRSAAVAPRGESKRRRGFRDACSMRPGWRVELGSEERGGLPSLGSGAWLPMGVLGQLIS